MLKLIKLEDRIVLDADALAVAAEQLVDEVVEAGAELTDAVIDAVRGSEPVAPVSDIVSKLENTDVFDFGALDAEPVVPESDGLRVTLISNGLEDYGYLATVASLNSEVIVYDAANESMSQVLDRVKDEVSKAGRSVSHLAIMSHGDAGRINFGSDSLTAANLSEFDAAFAGMRSWMANDASIAVYSCNVVDGSGQGTALVDGLADVTGATVYASDDITGRGGDWRLEYGSHGAVVVEQITPPVVQAALEKYQGSLGGPTATQPALWLKADAGVEEGADDAAEDGDTVTRWLDQSGNDRHLTTGESITYSTAGSNGQSSVNLAKAAFDAVELDAPDGGIYTVFTIQKASDPDYAAGLYGFGDGRSNTQDLLYFGDENDGALGLNTYRGDVHGVQDGTDFITDWGIIGAEFYSADDGYTHDDFQIELNGVAQDETDAGYRAGNDNALDSTFRLGSLHATNTTFKWQGEISEVIIYSGALSDAEKVLVTNYLASKYGIDLGANDQYNADTELAGNYDHEVGGIGQDGNGDNITSGMSDVVSIDNPDGLDNNEYLMFGHDGGDSESWTSTGAPDGYLRVDRSWAVDSDDVGAVDLTIDVSGLPASGSGSYVLLVDADGDGDFSDATVEALSGSGDTRSLTDYTLPDGAVFTIATSNSDPVVDTNAGLTLDEGASATIGAAQLTVSDAEDASDAITFTLTGLPGNGELRLNDVALESGDSFTQDDIDSGNLVYVHSGNEEAADAFRFTVADGNGGSLDETTFDITVTPQNDTPVLAVNAGLTLNEGDSSVISNLQLSVTDVDQEAADVRFTLTSVPDNGQLRRDGVALGVSDTFSQADIDAGLLSYTHDGGETTADEFAFSVSDGAGGVIGATTFSISVTAQNDAPELTVPGAQAADEGESVAIGGISVTDVDAGDDDIEITLSSNNGSLSLGSVAGLSFSTGDGSDDDSMVFTGTVEDINTALSSLSYRSDDDFSGADQISISVDDQSDAGALQDADSITVNVTGEPGLDVPVDQVVDEDDSLEIAGIALSSVDADSVTVTLSVGQGLLSIADTDGLVFSAGDGVRDSLLAFSGSVADVNSALASLSYLTATNSTAADTLSISVTDGDGFDDSGEVGITVNAVNDAPVLTVGETVEAVQDESVPIDSVSVVDIDAEQVEVALSVGDGVLNLGLLAGLEFTSGDGTDDARMVFRGSTAAVNDALQTLRYQGNDGYSGEDVLAVNVSDLGGEGSGGALADSDVITISIENTTPPWESGGVVAGALLNRGATLVLDQEELSFAGGEIAPDQLFYQLTSVPDRGQLLRDGNVMTVGGLFTQADINAGLIEYRNDGAALANDLFQFVVSDGELQTGNKVFDIQINSLPELTVNTGLAMDAGAQSVLSAGQLSVTDLDADADDIYFTLSRTPTHGQLLLNGAALGAGDSFTQADINAGLVSILSSFSGTVGAVVGDSFSFTVADNQGGYLGETSFSMRMTQQAVVVQQSDGSAAAERQAVADGAGIAALSDVDLSEGGGFESLFDDRSDDAFATPILAAESGSDSPLSNDDQDVSSGIDVTGDIALLLRPQGSGDFFDNLSDSVPLADAGIDNIESLVTQLGEPLTGEFDGERLANAESDEQRIGFAQFNLLGGDSGEEEVEPDQATDDFDQLFVGTDGEAVPEADEAADSPYFDVFARALREDFAETKQVEQADSDNTDARRQG